MTATEVAKKAFVLTQLAPALPARACCGTCRYFKLEHPNDGLGECRRHAPRVQFDRHGGDGVASVWPPVEQADFCGEFAVAPQLTLNFGDHDRSAGA